jgi:hypothetical protein
MNKFEKLAFCFPLEDTDEIMSLSEGFKSVEDILSLRGKEVLVELLPDEYPRGLNANEMYDFTHEGKHYTTFGEWLKPTITL